MNESDIQSPHSVGLADTPPPLKKKGRKKKSPAISLQEIADKISTGEITKLELVDFYQGDQMAAQVAIEKVMTEYRISLKAEFFDAVRSTDLPSRISMMLKAEADSIVKFRETDGGVLIFLASK